jgi:hypothetical protein
MDFFATQKTGVFACSIQFFCFFVFCGNGQASRAAQQPLAEIQLIIAEYSC